MGVPNTTTFSLQDVADEFDLGSNDGLIDCFEEATSGDFDPAFSGDKDELLNFRNYGNTPITWTAFTATGTSNNVCACASTPRLTRYHNGDGTFPVIGDKIAFNNDGSSPVGNGFTVFQGAGNVKKCITTFGSFPNVGTIINITLCP